jgi:hypothetical protein
MIFTVVACGDSAKNWIPRGTSIGSNDCEKFGKPVDYLIVANSPVRFSKERMEIIKKSKAKFFSHDMKRWRTMFPNGEQLTKITFFNTRILPGYVYTSVTTPIMCVSMAIRMGAKEVVIWGMDMKSHHTYSEGTKKGDHEIMVYKKFFTECKRLGIKIWIGSLGTAFDGFLPVYPANGYAWDL